MKYILSLVIFLSSTLAFAQDKCLLDEPKPAVLVVDQANIISPETEVRLNEILNEFNRETSNQILVVTVNDLCGYDKSEFTYTLGEKWGVGQKEFDNGVVLMVKPHGSAGDRHTFIAVGYGLEGAIPDAISKRIVEKELIPYFKQGDFEGGILNGVTTLMSLAKGEISVEQYQKSERIPLFPVFIILLIIIAVIFSSVKRMQRSSIGRDMSFWTALWLLSQVSNRNRGSWTNFHSGSGHFGGGSSFGGFGGGSFGGGGAGGSW